MLGTNRSMFAVLLLSLTLAGCVDGAGEAETDESPASTGDAPISGSDPGESPPPTDPQAPTEGDPSPAPATPEAPAPPANSNPPLQEADDPNVPGEPENGDAPAPVGSDTTNAEKELLHEEVMALMAGEELRCTQCHDAGDRLNLESGTLEDFVIRLVDVESSSSACVGELAIDSSSPADSLFLRLIDASSNEPECLAKMPLGSAGIASQHFELFERWIAALVETRGTVPPPDFGVAPADEGPIKFVSSDEAVEAPALPVLRRVKYLIAGSALTSAELTSASTPDGKLIPAEFERLVGDWLASDDFTNKRRDFFELALQQNPADGNYTRQLRNTRVASASAVVRNLEESLLRTAERIYQEEDDFRSIIWTTRHEVTTGVLITLKMLDNAAMYSRLGNFEKGNAINNLRNVTDRSYSGPRDPQYLNDTSDWRTVDLRYVPDSIDMDTISGFEDGSNITALREVGDGDSVMLRTPRTLCSSPAFFQMWQTNEDNRFRAQVNQCLIIALGQTFATGDPTTPEIHPFPGVNTAEIPENSECMGCHKNLDPMTSAFEAHFDYRHQRFRPNSQASLDHYVNQSGIFYNYDPASRPPYYDLTFFPDPYFSFEGINAPEDDLLSLLRSIAEHPDFAVAWAFKICNWASSVACNRGDPELQRIATNFADSGFRLDRLFEAFFTSKLMTHTYLEEESSYPGAQVSVARRDHFCHAIRVRLRDTRILRGLGDTDENTDFCGSNSKLAEGIPKDSALRGAVDFNLPRSISALSSISLSNLCSSGIDQLVGGNNRTFPRGDDQAGETIGLMVSQMLGYPEATPRYVEAKASLEAMHRVFRTTGTAACTTAEQFNSAVSEVSPSCGLGLSEQDAMENVFSLACQSPSITTVGM